MHHQRQHSCCLCWNLTTDWASGRRENFVVGGDADDVVVVVVVVVDGVGGASFVPERASY